MMHCYAGILKCHIGIDEICYCYLCVVANATRISFLRSKYFKAKPFQLPLGKFHCGFAAITMR